MLEAPSAWSAACGEEEDGGGVVGACNAGGAAGPWLGRDSGRKTQPASGIVIRGAEPAASRFGERQRVELGPGSENAGLQGFAGD